MARRPQKYKHGKVSGPVKSAFEGAGGFFGLLAGLSVAGSIYNDASFGEIVAVAAFFGIPAGVCWWIASLIPSKNQYTQK